ncbi:AraC family transcriptional regulator [Mucisphaera sp.]|uniref:AraC family transcriptional regulator n=1 Tax=Mucisphaera sp. TaxID=2913024 RepID=UPI003D12667F
MTQTQTKTQTGPPPDAWTDTDPLGQTLHALRMTAVVYARSHLHAPWGFSLPPMDHCLLYHVVTAGQCWLDLPGSQPTQLVPGEFALVPHGQGHALLSQPGQPAPNYFDLPVQRLTPHYETLDLTAHNPTGQRTTLICGAVRFEHPAARELIAMLPPLLHLQTWGNHQTDWMHNTLRLMAAELQSEKPGGETIVTRLADILVIQAIRSWIENNCHAHTGWLAGLHDDKIGPAIRAIHKDPTHPWTLASLADAACMSRSAFAARFNQIVGETPMHHLTRWRMHLASGWLHDTDITISQCAQQLGYTSEAAFNRAFKRILKTTPGNYRKTSRQQAIT